MDFLIEGGAKVATFAPKKTRTRSRGFPLERLFRRRLSFSAQKRRLFESVAMNVVNSVHRCVIDASVLVVFVLPIELDHVC